MIDYDYEYGYLNGMSAIFIHLGLDVDIKRTQDRGSFNICLAGNIVHSGRYQTCREYLLDLLTVKKMENDKKALMTVAQCFAEKSKMSKLNVLQLAAMLDMLYMLTTQVVYLHIEDDMTYSLTSSLNGKNVLFAGNFELCRNYICRVIKNEGRSKNE